MNLTISSKALGNSTLPAVFNQAIQPKGSVLLSHNLSGSMKSPIIQITAEELVKRGYNTLQYNFHYVNTIGPEKARWEDIVLDAEAAFETLKDQDTTHKYFVVGKSIGLLASLHLTIQQKSLKGVVGGYSFPLNISEKYLDLHLLKKSVSKMTLFQGTNDQYGTAKRVEEFLSPYIANLTLVPVKDGIHSFDEQFPENEVRMIVKHFLDLHFGKNVI